MNIVVAIALIFLIGFIIFTIWVDKTKEDERQALQYMARYMLCVCLFFCFCVLSYSGFPIMSGLSVLSVILISPARMVNK